MEKILQSIFVHVDASSKTLANNAIAQLLIKLLYTCDKPIKKDEFARMIDEQTHMSISTSDSFDAIMDTLVERKEIAFKKGEYCLSSSKRERIKKTIETSKERIEKILDVFFSGMHSEREVIREWFQDITIKFFEIYADQWISDLLAGSQHIRNLGESIRSTLINRTRTFPNLDKRDEAELTNRFFTFVTTRNSDVDAYLWEHGTSRFSALLISNRQGVDSLTLESFSNSTCLLDTNVLIFIALGAKDKIKSYEQLEKAFELLGISVNVLYITKSEYERRIDIQRESTIKNIEKMGDLATKIPNDSFTQCALERQCTKKEDFETFFDILRELPPYVTNKLKIELLDHSKSLENAIENAQKDETKKENLKKLYFALKNREKLENATIHDVGLIEGAEFLRKQGKYFILSEETSVNAYSQNKPTDNGLPISIRVETLLNILAANGNTMTDSSDYMSLYADLIRLDLFPSEKTFTQCQLYQMYELNNRISNLPEKQSERIVWAAHEKMMHGAKDDELRLFINDRITETEITLKDEVAKKDEVINDYKNGLKEASRHTEQYKNALVIQWRKEIRNRLIRKTVFRLSIPLIILIIGGVLAYYQICSFENSEGLGPLYINLAVTAISELFYMNCRWFKEGVYMLCHRNDIVEQELRKRIKDLEN